MLALLTLLVFSLGFALDYADTRHKIAVEERDGHVAGMWSVLMYLLGTLGTWSVIDVAGWLVVPGAAGLYFGSRVAIRCVTRRSSTDSAGRRRRIVRNNRP